MHPRLAGRLRASSGGECRGPTTKLGDWYANLVYLPGEQVVLFVNERSLLPVLVPARDARSLVARMQHTLRDVLLRIGVPAEAVEAELREMKEARVGKTSSRQTLGSMTDFTVMLRVGGRSGPLLDESLDLAEAPCSPLRSGARGKWRSSCFRRLGKSTRVRNGSNRLKRGKMVEAPGIESGPLGICCARVSSCSGRLRSRCPACVARFLVGRSPCSPFPR